MPVNDRSCVQTTEITARQASKYKARTRTRFAKIAATMSNNAQIMMSAFGPS